MRAETLPLAAIPHVSRLYSSYLTQFDRVASFYARSPFTRDSLAAEAVRLRYPADRRQRVADILEKQNRDWGAPAKAMENISRLRQGAVAVVTGQQVGVFGGPMFALLKALTAVKLAAESSADGVDAVPVFWLATEDHDLAEVSTVNLPLSSASSGPALEIISVSPADSTSEDSPVGAVCFGDEMEAAVAVAAGLLGDCEVSDWLRQSYTPGASFGDAFARLFTRLFAEFGLILFDASGPECHRIAEPVFCGAARRSDELNAALLARGKELECAGFHAQVKVTPSSTLLFRMEGGVRTPVQRVNHHYATGNNGNNKTRFTAAELAEQVGAHPEEFSANALLRPVVQDYLLPTLAYVGGPAEVAYFAQTAVIYQALLGRITPILPRISATLVEPKVKRRLDRYGISVADVFTGRDQLQRLLANRSLPAELKAEFDNAKTGLDALLAPLRGSLTKLDPTLAESAGRSASKMRYQLNRMAGRAANAELRRNGEIARHAAELSTALYPHGNLQEREIGGVYFLARYGTYLLHLLCQHCQTASAEHQVFYL